MALKRKRSAQSLNSTPPLSTSSSSSTLTNTDGQLPFIYAQSKPVESLYYKPTWSFPTYESDEPFSSHHLGSRTRKRHRDDRPDESSVHASTISKLFSAQREHPHAEPVLSSESQTTITSVAPVPAQRSTLHSFWNINSRPITTFTSSAMSLDSGPATTMDAGLKCEDCDGPVRSEDAMELDGDMEVQEAACYYCRRRVCDGCAVLGDHRVCLGCATGKG